MQEIWKDIRDYEGLYQISNNGNVKSLGRWVNYKNKGKKWQEGKILKPLVKKGGYLHVGLWKNGKVKFFIVHRLVAQAFIPNPNNLPQVNHKDENKENNVVKNLEYCDAKYNSNYGTRNKRVAEKMKGKKLSDETRKKISETKRGKKNHMYGKHLSEEHKKKISEKQINGKKSKPVLQINKDTNEIIRVFPSAMEVERQLGYKHSNIVNSCRGKLKSAYGYKWKYN